MGLASLHVPLHPLDPSTIFAAGATWPKCTTLLARSPGCRRSARDERRPGVMIVSRVRHAAEGNLRARLIDERGGELIDMLDGSGITDSGPRLIDERGGELINALDGHGV